MHDLTHAPPLSFLTGSDYTQIPFNSQVGLLFSSKKHNYEYQACYNYTDNEDKKHTSQPISHKTKRTTETNEAEEPSATPTSSLLT